MISKILQILSLQPRISKVSSRSLEQFFLTVGQNNFGNKVPFIFECLYIKISPVFYLLHGKIISELELNRFKMQQSQSQFNDKIEET